MKLIGERTAMDICGDGREDKCLHRTVTKYGANNAGIAVVCCRKGFPSTFNGKTYDFAQCRHHDECATHKTYYEAEAYCNGLGNGYRLCTESEIDEDVCCEDTVKKLNTESKVCEGYNKRRAWTSGECTGECTTSYEKCNFKNVWGISKSSWKCVEGKDQYSTCKCDFQCKSVQGMDMKCAFIPFPVTDQTPDGPDDWNPKFMDNLCCPRDQCP